MENSCGDVGIVSRNLAEAFGAIGGSNANNAYVAACEGFKAFDFQAGFGGKCLSTKYINSTYKLLFICKEGHKWRATPLEIMGKKNGPGSWCPKCKRSDGRPHSLR